MVGGWGVALMLVEEVEGGDDASVRVVEICQLLSTSLVVDYCPLFAI